MIEDSLDIWLFDELAKSTCTSPLLCAAKQSNSPVPLMQIWGFEQRGAVAIGREAYSHANLANELGDP
jgi:hypothetical protein